MKNKGQSTVEYLMLVAAIIGIVIFFTYGDKSFFRSQVNNTIAITTQGMTNMANKLMNGM